MVLALRLVTVKVPELYLEGIDELVRGGRYSSRSEVIRTAIRDLLRRELWSPPPKASRVSGGGDLSIVRRVVLHPT
ncbi:MAG: type II toxin-antitoxin system ParD family antitoxin [Desulfurococcales archaeon]|nr:type II toxin-antitoxin system ParD family antitoxin [Desulfurococcales archaeon]